MAVKATKNARFFERYLRHNTKTLKIVHSEKYWKMGKNSRKNPKKDSIFCVVVHKKKAHI